VIGAKRAREMWMLCRRYPALEALQMGLVNRVVPLASLEGEVDQWCEELLSVSPGCLEILKASFDQEMDGYADLGVISSQFYPDWFDMPEPPRFWSLRESAHRMREKLVEEYEGEGD
jgi:naphthoate synthase/2-ketocyclohexanecarboxyl-CoA hydrolase